MYFDQHSGINKNDGKIPEHVEFISSSMNLILMSKKLENEENKVFGIREYTPKSWLMVFGSK